MAHWDGKSQCQKHQQVAERPHTQPSGRHSERIKGFPGRGTGRLLLLIYVKCICANGLKRRWRRWRFLMLHSRVDGFLFGSMRVDQSVYFLCTASQRESVGVYAVHGWTRQQQYIMIYNILPVIYYNHQLYWSHRMGTMTEASARQQQEVMFAECQTAWRQSMNMIIHVELLSD